MRKRWPAIEPHWRVLYESGATSKCADSRENAIRNWWNDFVQYGGRAAAAIAIIKVTPK